MIKYKCHWILRFQTRRCQSGALFSSQQSKSSGIASYFAFHLVFSKNHIYINENNKAGSEKEHGAVQVGYMTESKSKCEKRTEVGLKVVVDQRREIVFLLHNCFEQCTFFCEHVIQETFLNGVLDDDCVNKRLLELRHSMNTRDGLI